MNNSIDFEVRKALERHHGIYRDIAQLKGEQSLQKQHWARKGPLKCVSRPRSKEVI